MSSTKTTPRFLGHLLTVIEDWLLLFVWEEMSDKAEILAAIQCMKTELVGTLASKADLGIIEQKVDAQAVELSSLK